MLQLRCTYCQTPFALRREEALIALQEMALGDLAHFDAHCPKCRRANQIPRNRLEHAYPGWKQALKELEKEAARAEKEQAEEIKVEKPSQMKKGKGKAVRTAASAKPSAAPSAKKSALVKKPAKPAASPKEKQPAAKSSTTVKQASKAKKE